MRGAFFAFVPNFYPQKGRLFEPYAHEDGDEVKEDQIGGQDGHDYTQHSGYQKMVAERKPFWSEPYDYQTASGTESLTTFSYPLLDERDSLVAVCGVDVLLSWLGDTLNATRYYPSSYDLLLTEDGQLVAGPSENIVTHHQRDRALALINDKSIARKTTRNEHIKVIEFYDSLKQDEGYIYYARMKDEPNWQVALVCYDGEVFGKLKKMRIHIALFMFAGFLLVGLIIHRTISNIMRLHQVDMEQERIGGELRIAQNIPQSMLPKQFPPFPERGDLDIFGQLVPAREVGGDIFDFFVRDEKLFFCIGDVSGKGVPSSMVMAQAHSLFRMASAGDSRPDHVVQSMNDVLCQNNESSMFITFFLGVLDLPTGRLHYCNAGHDRPVLVGRGRLDANPHLPLGVFTDVKYTMQTIQLDSGTTLFLYTDGLTEAKNAERNQFGLSRVMETLAAGDDCQSLITKMTDAVHRFVEDAEQSDDLTMLAIRYLKQDDFSVLDESLTLKNDIRQTTLLNSFMKDVLSRLGIDDKLARSIRLGVEEAVVNVMEYAYPNEQEGEVHIAARADGERLKLIVSDDGIPFDPTDATRIDTSLSAEERPIGGLGVHLIRELMDSINYERVDGRNVLTLSKNYQSN